MRPTIFIHLKDNINFLKYCLEHFKEKCEIIVNCYGKKESIIEFCRENSAHFYQIVTGNKNDIVKSLPHSFEHGIWLCNDDVVIEGDIWPMFELAYNNQHCVDLIYPPVDSLMLNKTKLGKHKRHRLNSPAFFLTGNGIRKLRLAQPLSYTYTYYGATIRQWYDVIDTAMTIDNENTNEPVYITHQGAPRLEIEKQLLNPVNSSVNNIVSKNIVITFSSKGREFITKTKETIKNISENWGADFRIYTDASEVISQDQLDILSSVDSKRSSIVNYFVKMLCIYDALQTHDRVLWLDDTCIVSPFAQNLFKIVPEESIGGLIIKRDLEMGESNNDFNFIKEKRGIETDDVYINSGVVLASKCNQGLFSFEEMYKDRDLFESFYPTQAYIIYKLTTEKIPVYDLTSINHFMPAMLKYEDKLFTLTETLSAEQDIIASHAIAHFSGYHKHREILHEEMVKHFKQTFDQNITLVVMNFSRPDNIKNHILPFYTTIPAINQIIVSHCKESAIFEYSSTNSCEIVHRNDVETDNKYGIFTRFIAASESSKNKCVVFIDDDMIVPAHVLAQLFIEWKKTPTRVIGTRGRMIKKEQGNWEYDSSKYVKEADVVLTHCAMTSKQIVDALVKQEPIFHETAMQSKVRWNGEDIFLSLFARFINQEKNLSIHSKYIDLSNEGSISSTDDHLAARNKIVNDICSHYKDIATRASRLEFNVSHP